MVRWSAYERGGSSSVRLLEGLDALHQAGGLNCRLVLVSFFERPDHLSEELLAFPSKEYDHLGTGDHRHRLANH